MNYEVNIGSGQILEGSVTGKIHFYFNKNGLVVHIPDTEQYFSKKNINGISFKTTIRDKIKKGSSLAKIAAFKAATNRNNKNIGQQIAVSQRFADMGRDTVVQEEIKITVINIKSLGELIIDLGSDSGVQKNLVLAHNNPKSFFVQSVKDQKLQANVNKVSSKVFRIIGITFLWFIAVLVSFRSIQISIIEKDFDFFLYFVPVHLLLIYLIYRQLKLKKNPKKNLKSKWENFENSEEYKEILKNLS